MRRRSRKCALSEKTKSKLYESRAPCACIAVVAEHLPVIDVAKIVCDYLEKMTDEKVLYENMSPYPFRMIERAIIYRRIKKHYKNPLARHTEYSVVLMAMTSECWNHARYVFSLIESTDLSIKNHIFMGNRLQYHNPIFYLGQVPYRPNDIRMWHDTFNYYVQKLSWAAAMRMQAATIRLHRRAIAAIWGCRYRHK